MSDIDYHLYTNYFHNCTKLPIRYYQQNNLILQLPNTEFPFDALDIYHDTLQNQERSVAFITTKHSMYYGIIKAVSDPQHHFIIGPISNVAITRNILKEFLREADIPFSRSEDLLVLYHSFPVMSFNEILNFLCFINFTINHTQLSLEDLLDVTDDTMLVPIKTEHTSKVFEAKENQSFHNTYQFEKLYLSMIENGDLASLRKLVNNPIYVTPGILADNNIRQNKNIFITAATLTTRAAIKGGLDAESAYQLSDVYIQKMEKLTSIHAILNLQYQMLFDFTERVQSSKIPEGISKTIYECINFINTNTNQPISVVDVARNVHKSRSFISRKFKQELGFGINEFINSRKIEEAKYLLSYSDKSISEISCYLCFSSQSYFQNVFKKKTGLTPNEYRLKTLSGK